MKAKYRFFKTNLNGAALEVEIEGNLDEADLKEIYQVIMNVDKPEKVTKTNDWSVMNNAIQRKVTGKIQEIFPFDKEDKIRQKLNKNENL